MSQNLQEPPNPIEKPREETGDGGVGADLLCTICGGINPRHARFCARCGQRLNSTGQMSAIPLPQSTTPLPDDAIVLFNSDAEAGAPIFFPAPANEVVFPDNENQWALHNQPPAGSPNMGGATPIISNGMGRKNSGNWGRRIRSRRFLVISLIALVLLLIASSLPFLLPYLHTILPADTATVTITPTSQTFTNSYQMFAVTGTPDASQKQVQARNLSITKSASKTVQATGQGAVGATEATGTLIFSNSTGNFTIFAQTFSDNSGNGLTIDSSFNISPGQTLSIFAHAAIPGTNGNVPVDDINATFTVGANLGKIHIENTSPFAGGTDRTFAFVQQSDIDSATSDLVNQLTADTQTAVQQQMRANETTVNSVGVQCTSRNSADHRANDQVANFTVRATVTCTSEVFDQQGAKLMATSLLQSDAATQLGSDHMLVGQVALTTPLTGTPGNNGAIPISIDAQGVWAYQFSTAQLQNIAQIITGKTQSEANSLLIKQKGVSKAIIKTFAGWGMALPTSAAAIKLVVSGVTV